MSHTEPFDRYIVELRDALAKLDRGAIADVVSELLCAWREGRTVFFAGNGGSAATAAHFVVDMTKTAMVPGCPPLRAISLTDNLPSLTAWANDVSYDVAMSERLRALASPGDVLVAISCSGTSRNVLGAVQTARALGLRTIGLSGRDGGSLKDMVDVCVCAPAAWIGQQEDIHMVLDHAITLALRDAMLAESTRIDGAAVRAMILAAGEGTRLRPLTDTCAKAVLPVGGKPAMEHVLEWLRSYGIRDVAVNLHHCPESITDRFGGGERVEMRLTYSREPELLGTAGGVLAMRSFLDRRFVLVYGDVLTDLDLGELVRYHAAKVAALPAGSPALTMALSKTTRPTEVGLADVADDGRIRRFVEKPSRDAVFSDLAHAGILVLEPGILDHIPAGKGVDFGCDVFPALLERGVPMFGWPIPKGTYLADYGSLEAYARAQVEWPARRCPRDVGHGRAGG
ncbi:MAG: sugar phosphate nucleotidyltransferase [Candidatus Bipolaricaulis sp.]|nr:sugar phosphate nucleotidyltransferase [Candidatus Bipolaricaulis sp.]